MASTSALLCAILTCFLAHSAASSSFVSRRGAQLLLDNRPFYFIGANAYWLMDVAKMSHTRNQVDRFFKYCNSYGLTVVRMWAFNEGCPSAPGVYDPVEMAAFDYIINSAGSHKIKLILALGNTWTAYRSPEDFFLMAGVNPANKTLLDWYGSRPLRDLYKSHITAMVTRKNSLNGLEYREDPTIMMWDVINEPRCPGCTQHWQQQVHLSFLKEMSDYLRAMASKQLTAVGTEGYYMDAAHLPYNPGAGAFCEGEDWIAMSAIGSVDVTTAHIYDRQVEAVPPTWRQPTFEDIMNFFSLSLSSHTDASRAQGKPFVVEEFNLLSTAFSTEQRAQLFQLVYDALVDSAKSGGALAGAMFWNAAIGSDVGDDGYNVYLDVGGGVMPSRRLFGSGAGPGQPVRQAVVANTEGLDAFRGGPQRLECAEAEARSGWLPLWAQSGGRSVSLATYEQRTSHKQVQDIIRQTAGRLPK
ncbi:glycoside hydrolase superfamily [Haematococcus lacustris]